MKQVFKEAGETVRARSKSREKQKKELSISQKEKDEATKSKIGGFFSSMFKSKPKQKAATPTSPQQEVLSPEMKAMSNVEFKFDNTGKLSREDLKQLGQTPTPETSHKQDKVSSDKSESEVPYFFACFFFSGKDSQSTQDFA